MKIKAQIVIKDGKARWVGKGRFASIDCGQFSVNEISKPFEFFGLKLRVITFAVSRGAYVNRVVVVRETRTNLAIAKTLSFVSDVAAIIGEAEIVLFQVKEGEVFPKHSLSSFLWRRCQFIYG